MDHRIFSDLLTLFPSSGFQFGTPLLFNLHLIQGMVFALNLKMKIARLGPVNLAAVTKSASLSSINP